MTKFYLYLILLIAVFNPGLYAQCYEDLHDNKRLTSWASCTALDNPNSQHGQSHWIMFDFGEVYYVDSVHLWNYNDSLATYYGFNDYVLDHSLNGASWTTAGTFSLNQAPGTQAYEGDPGPVLNGQAARFVLLTALSNHGGSCYGLSEVKFTIESRPECEDFDLSAICISPSCPDGTNGSIALFPDGGNPPYSFAWAHGPADGSLSGLEDDQYEVAVTDQLGCVDGMSIDLTAPLTHSDVYNDVPIPTGQYYDDSSITSGGLVAFNGHVSLLSSTEVGFSEEFEVVTGGKFLANVGDCDIGSIPPALYAIEKTSNPLPVLYKDFLGAGQTKGITVSASSESLSTRGFYAIGGHGLLPDFQSASRFLAQASLGANWEAIEDLTTMGVDNWLEWQCELPLNTYSNAFDSVIAHVYDTLDGNNLTEFTYFRMAWWQNVLTGDDLLRDRVALALSEIFVVSDKSDLAAFGEGLASYYDVLYVNALGNFRDLLFDVTMHPSMGVYLSHVNNPKSDTALNQYPDENYAREVMQLFSIGLRELSEDGTNRLNVYGKTIPTYGNDEVVEFAKIFTGLGFDADNAEFGSRRFYDFTVPMIMYDDYHEAGEKMLLNGTLVPDGQSPMDDINSAVDNLFNHPNVGPFIGRRLIQRLVKSNPSPQYLARVSQAFDDNGSGVRGDMKAVIRAILTDPEARGCSWIEDSGAGMLREPLVRYTHFLRAFDVFSNTGNFYSVGKKFYELTFQAPLAAPSVFNFFIPDYIPHGPAGDAFLFGPEFQILNSYTAVGFYNIANDLKDNRNVLPSSFDTINVDFTDEFALALDAELLVDRLDLLLSHGTLSTGSREVIVSALDSLPADPDTRLKMALYLFFTCPEYVILK